MLKMRWHVMLKILNEAKSEITNAMAINMKLFSF